jgi:hypothetical protein
MAKLVFGLQQSLDGYVDHLEMGPPGPTLSCHFVEHVRPRWLCVWSPHVRDHALLGRRPARLGRGGSRLRGGVAKPPTGFGLHGNRELTGDDYADVSGSNFH